MEWIKCSEKLPEIGVTVLVLTKWGYIRDLTLRKYMNGGFYFSPGGLESFRDVTHWMPIPPPPEEEE